MAKLKNHPTFWLRDDAAAAFNALEDKYGIFTVNSAGRTEAEQQALINRWNAGGVYNRPPYLFHPASPAKTSPHVANGGVAVDIREYDRFKQVAGEFGFSWFGSGDPVHFNFHGWNGQPSGGASFSQEVQNQQKWLNVARGANLQADGKLGPLTKDAITRYEHFLHDWGYGYNGPYDGVWGPGVQKAHQGYYNTFNTPHPNTGRGAKGQWVKDIQYRLNVAGFKVAVDGDFGPATDNAVRGFQRSRNLAVDGIVGISTRRPLGL